MACFMTEPSQFGGIVRQCQTVEPYSRLVGMPDPKPGVPKRPGPVGKYAGLAILLPISTMVGYGMGFGLDHLFHTGWIRYVFLCLGTVSGFIELIRELNKDL